MTASHATTMNQIKTTEFWLLASLLVTALLLPAIGGNLVSYIALAIVLLACLFLLISNPRPALNLDSAWIVFAGSFVLLALTCILTAHTTRDMLSALNFSAFLIYIPLVTLLGRSAGSRAIQIVAWLAFGGAALGAIYSVGEIILTGVSRAGTFGLHTDPIRLANSSLLLGFLALVGVQQQSSKLRFVLLLGPILGLLAVMACGTRTSMVAFAVMALCAALAMARSWKWRIAMVVAIGVPLLIVLNVEAVRPDRVTSLMVSIQQILTGAEVADRSMDIRLDLYRSAIAAFNEAPIFGHGWRNKMVAIAPYLSAQYADQAAQPHVHNDLLNFAVSSGIVGVAVFLTLLATPLVLALRSPADSQKEARVLGCFLILVGYIVMGLADTMISYETHTALYVIWTAVLLAYCKDERFGSPASSSA
jgi:O-antigen ligase